MNAVVGQMLRCTIHELNEDRQWNDLLPMIEFAINSLPNTSSGCSEFSLNFGFHPVVPIELVKGNNVSPEESVNSFSTEIESNMGCSKEEIRHTQELQAQCYNQKHRHVRFKKNDLVILSTVNL